MPRILILAKNPLKSCRKVTEQLVAKPKQEGMPYVFQSNAKTKINSVFQSEAKNEIRKPKFKSLFQNEAKTKTKIQIRFSKCDENVQKSNPFFNVTGK